MLLLVLFGKNNQETPMLNEKIGMICDSAFAIPRDYPGQEKYERQKKNPLL